MKSPFKFLDAFKLSDRDYFFGREKEMEELYSLVFKTPLLLIYGLSGTGKTSLIQCGLASQFEGPDWYPFSIRRNENINNSIFNELSKAVKDVPQDSLPHAVSHLFKHYLRPVYLIFDQFEELFILGSDEEQEEFVKSIQQLLEADLPCKILLVMREEYIGHLYHFEKSIPTIFDFRLRVEPMNHNRVIQVMNNSFEQFNIHLQSPEEELARKMVENLSLGKSGIQLPYLQVYLDMLYRDEFQDKYGDEDPEEELPMLIFSHEKIKEFGKIDDVLEKFLEEQQANLQEEIKGIYPDVSETAVKDTLDVFVTDEGTKRPINYIYKNEIIQLSSSVKAHLPDLSEIQITTILQLLEKNRILNSNEKTYELAHDSLAVLIDQNRTDEQRQLNEVKKRILNNYREYLETGEFLSRKQLTVYEDFISKISFESSVLNFINKSWEHVKHLEELETQRNQKELTLVRQKLETEERSRKRQLVFSALLGLAAILASGFGFKAFTESKKAEVAKIKAQDQTEIAIAKTDSLQKAQLEIQLKSFQNFRDKGIARKDAGQYQDAITNFEAGKTFANNVSDSLLLDNLITESLGLAGTVAKIENLISKGDQYEKQGDLAKAEKKHSLYIKAGESYKKALALNFESKKINILLGRIKNKLDKELESLSQKFKDANNLQSEGGKKRANQLQSYISEINRYFNY